MSWQQIRALQVWQPPRTVLVAGPAGVGRGSKSALCRRTSGGLVGQHLTPSWCRSPPAEYGSRCTVGHAGDGVDQMAQGAAEAVELPHDERVAGAEPVQELLEDGPVGAGAAGGLGECPVAHRRAGGRRPGGPAAGRGGDAGGVTEQVSHVHSRSRMGPDEHVTSSLDRLGTNLLRLDGARATRGRLAVRILII